MTRRAPEQLRCDGCGAETSVWPVLHDPYQEIADPYGACWRCGALYLYRPTDGWVRRPPLDGGLARREVK